MRKKIAIVLVLLIIMSNSFSGFAATSNKLITVIADTANYLYKTVDAPIVGSVGGEWAVLGLARSDYEIPEEYYEKYYHRVVDYVKKHKGVLHKKKYTEYSRLVVALTALGKNPLDVGGYNLLTPLGDYEKTIWQGINGPIWALIALDSGNYSMPVNKEAKVKATRKMYVDRILDCQLEDGGFSLFGGTEFENRGGEVSDPDITGMALQALAKYQYREDVKKTIDSALTTLSNLQNSEGGFSSWGSMNSESCVQVIVALSELNIPLDDPRFIKDGNTLLDNLLSFYRPNNGFLHTASGNGVNLMATEQAFYGLVAALRLTEGKNSLYRMSDSIHIGTNQSIEGQQGKGLIGKHKDVKPLEFKYLGKTFHDIRKHKHCKEIELLAAKGIINGKGDSYFDPNATMTRAEFASIIIKALGLRELENTKFTDVKEGSWYEKYVGAAYNYGIINGKGDSIFDPTGTVTKEEAAVMVAKAARLAGIDNEKEIKVRDILAQFLDYIQVSEWARKPLAFCYQNEILSKDEMEINPQTPIKRYEVAVMIYNLLIISNLI